MNTNTGEIYRGEEVIQAQRRGEPLVPLTEEEAHYIEGMSNRRERRREAKRLGVFGRRRLSFAGPSSA